MTLRSRKYTTAWLGLIAMWLLVFAPLVSQLLASAHAHEPIAAICSAAQHNDSGRHLPAAALDACGYCTLLAGQVLAPQILPAALPVLPQVAIAAAPELSIYFTPSGVFPSGRPRDPPLVS